MASKFINRADGGTFLQYKNQFRQELDENFTDDEIQLWRKARGEEGRLDFNQLSEVEREVLENKKDVFPNIYRREMPFALEQQTVWQGSTQLTEAKALKKIASEQEDLRGMWYPEGNSGRLAKEGVDQLFEDSYDTIRNNYLKVRAFNQAYMEKARIGKERVYRGIGGDPGRSIRADLEAKINEGDQLTSFDIEEEPLVAYTSNKMKASNFGVRKRGITYTREVPRDEIVVHRDLHSWITGKEYEEHEFIITGDKNSININNVEY